MLTQSSLKCSALDGVVNLWQVQDKGYAGFVILELHLYLFPQLIKQ